MIESSLQQPKRLKELENYADSLDLINEMGQLYNSTEDYQEIFKITAKYMPRVLPTAGRASITLLDDGGETFSIYALEGDSSIPLGSRVPLEGTAIGKAVKTEQLVIVTDLTADNYADCNLLDKAGFTSAMTIPLINGGQALGSINVATRTAFNARDEMLIEKIGSLFSSLLSSRILFSELRKVHTQIQQSINYASKIQSAVLPSEEELQKSLPESFVFYRPKDVVSGDFYWVSERDNLVFLAVGDCTGHGVPGCLMSMLGTNMINQLVKDRRCDNAGSFLYVLDRRLISMLRGDNNEVRVQDGMDMTYALINKETKKMRFASAKRPLILVRNGELTEIKGDRAPIGGGHYQNKKFTEHELYLNDNDTIYMFTDGMTDQFGGPDFRKYGSPNFRNFLQGLEGKSMADRKLHVENEFLSWMGKHDQTDDALLVGLKPIFS